MSDIPDNETFYMVIDTLQKKIEGMKNALWEQEMYIKNLESHIQDQSLEIKDLKEFLEHRDLEIEDLYNILNTASDVDRYMDLQTKNIKLSHDYDKMHESIKHLFDIEYTM